MCGRYSIYEIDALNLNFHSFTPVYNAAPSMLLPIITSDGPTFAKWGFVPNWAKDKKIQMINARAESISEKPAYKKAFLNQRCLIPANGFFEWKKTSVGKIPYFFQIKNQKLFFFAGIWETSPIDNKITFAILTTTPNNIVKKVHDRMPVILPLKNDWIEKPDVLILKPFDKEMNSYQVSDKINSPKNNIKEVLQKAQTLDF